MPGTKRAGIRDSGPNGSTRPSRSKAESSQTDYKDGTEPRFWNRRTDAPLGK